MEVDDNNDNGDWDYAFNEIHRLLSSLNLGLHEPINPYAPVFRYISALFAEMAYHHIPEWEVDKRKRAQIARVPSSAYQSMVGSGEWRFDRITQAFQMADLPRPFIATSAGVVAVGVVIRGILFIGFRGTALLFDWKVNLRAELVRVSIFQQTISHRFFDESCYQDKTIYCGGVHSGFAEESLRITKRIIDAIPAADRSSIKHVFLGGHSLGGAVAAISKNLIREWPTTAYLFGAPRYSDVGGYMTVDGDHPIQTRRPGDLVPTVPPRSYGFCDHPVELTTSGEEYIDTSLNSCLVSDIYNWMKFIFTKASEHSMEAYRKEIGEAVEAKLAKAPLTKARLIEKIDIRSTF